MRALEHKIPPPVLVLLIGATMWAAAPRPPAWAVQGPWRFAIAGILFGSGLLIDGLGVAAFRRAGTTTNPMKPEAASAMVTGGIYRYTRNPMYVGLTVVLLGWAWFLGAPWSLLGPVVFAAFVTRFQILPEERELRAKFGSAYGEYQRKVRRWL